MTLLLLASLAARAQDPTAPADAGPSAARLCADAAEGSEIDVCLQVATSYPEQVEGVSAALKARMDRRSSEDRALLQALLLLLSDDTGVEGARQLGALGDPRAVDPLAHAAEHREEDVAIEAVTSLARYDEGLEPLSRFLLDDQLPVAVRVASARALGTLGTDDAADALIQALRRRRVPPPLRQAMIETVEGGWPQRAGELEHTVSTDGSWWSAVGGGWGLGYSLAAGGYFGKAQIATYGGVAGAVAGTTTGFLAARAWPIEAGDAAFVTTNGIAGTVGGDLVAAAVDPSPSHEHRVAWGYTGGLAGMATGYGVGFALAGRHPGTGLDSAEAAGVSGLSALGAGATVDFFAPPPSERKVRGPELAAGVGTWAGIAVGDVVAPRITPTARDGEMIAISAAFGTATGALVPTGGRPRRSLPLAGFSAGALAGYALAGPLEPPQDVLLGAAGGTVMGGVFGLGAGALADPDNQTDGQSARTGAAIGAAVGLGAGTWAAWRNPQPPEWSDAVAIGFAAGWAGWQAAGWTAVAHGGDGAQGWALVAPAVAGTAVAVASPNLDIPTTSTLSAASLGLWGGYVAGVGAEVTHHKVLPWSLVGSDLGLGVGALAASPVLNTPPLTIGLADAGGVLGGSLGALGASFATTDPDTILGASLGGAAVGFTGGVVAGQALHGKTKDIALVVPLPYAPRLPGRWTLEPAAFAADDGPCYGAALQVTEW